MNSVENELKDIKEKIAEIEDKEQNISKDNIEIKHQLEKIEGIVKEHQSKLKHWTKEVSGNVMCEGGWGGVGSCDFFSTTFLHLKIVKISLVTLS